MLCSFKEENIGWKKIAFGQNYERSGYSISIHAEVNALNKLRHTISFRQKNKKHYDLLVVRLTKANKCGESRPCFHCLKTLLKSGINIKFVYYSTNDGTIVREKLNNMLHSKKTYISLGNRRRIHM